MFKNILEYVKNSLTHADSLGIKHTINLCGPKQLKNNIVYMKRCRHISMTKRDRLKKVAADGIQHAFYQKSEGGIYTDRNLLLTGMLRKKDLRASAYHYFRTLSECFKALIPLFHFQSVTAITGFSQSIL